jgi:hypothetical protein
MISVRETKDANSLRQWGPKEYIGKGSYLGWFVELVVSVQEIFVLPWLLQLAQY